MTTTKNDYTYIDVDAFRPDPPRKIKIAGKVHAVKDANTMTLGDWLDLGDLDKKMAQVYESKDSRAAIEAGVEKIRLLIPTVEEKTLRELQAAQFLQILDFVSKQAKVAATVTGNAPEGKARRRQKRAASGRR